MDDNHHGRNGPSRPPPPENSGVVCVSVRRGGHFWRFACDARGAQEMFERLADLSAGDSPLAREDARLIAAQVLSGHSPDRGQPAPAHDR